MGPYIFGCWSNHSKASTKVDNQQVGFCNDHFMLSMFATAFKDIATQTKKVPVLLSHYPIPLGEAEHIGTIGIKAYLHGHTHCTQLGPEPNFKWYDDTAGQTDTKTINGCYFSCGTTDVLLHKHKRILREIQLQKFIKKPGPKPHSELPKWKGEHAEKLIVFCGPPGAGKSTYAEALSKETGYKVVCRDILGTRQDCIKVAAKELSEGRSVIVDMTNINVPMRRFWTSLGRHYKVKDITCIVWRVDSQVCIDRCEARKGHPTMNEKIPAERKAEIVMQFVRQFEEPSKDEGFHTITEAPKNT